MTTLEYAGLRVTGVAPQARTVPSCARHTAVSRDEGEFRTIWSNIPLSSRTKGIALAPATARGRAARRSPRRPRLGARRAARVARYAVAVGRSYARVRAPTPPARAASTVPAVTARAHGTAARCTPAAPRPWPRRGAGVLGKCGDRRVSGKPQTRIGSLVESHYDTAYRYRRARARAVSPRPHVAHEPSRGHGSVSARSGSLPPPRRVPGPARSTADGARRRADRAHVSQARSGRHAPCQAARQQGRKREPWEQAATGTTRRSSPFDWVTLSADRRPATAPTPHRL